MTGPFHLVLRTAIRERGLPLDRLRSRLAERGIQIGLASLSDWQHGRARPQRPNSLRAVAVLEEILGLPRHALTGLLATHHMTPFRPQQGVDEYHGPMGELLDMFPGARDWNLEVITSEHAVTVDAHRSPSRVTVRSLARARRDDVDRTVVRYFGAPGCAIDRVRVVPVRNCAVGRLLRHREGRALAAELLFGQQLQSGETWVWEYELHDATTSESESDFAHAFRRPEGTCLMEVRFHPDALPSRVHDYFRTDLYVDRHQVKELMLNAHHAVHVATSGMNSGVIGISWEWPD